ncbi:hypothetical protein C0992_001519, partial [Termitomyces sp. T32_za158]
FLNKPHHFSQWLVSQTSLPSSLLWTSLTNALLPPWFLDQTPHPSVRRFPLGNKRSTVTTARLTGQTYTVLLW